MALAILSADRRLRVLTLGIAAAVCLYVLVVVVAEPLRSTAQSSVTSDSVITLTIDDFLTMNCSGALHLGSYSGATFTDSGPYSNTGSLICTVETNNTSGYQLGWLVQTGSGGTNTGYMISQYEDIISPFGTSSTIPSPWVVSATGAVWGGHMDTTDSDYNPAFMNFGTDGAGGNVEPDALWLRVATGSTVFIHERNSVTPVTGDPNRIGFRAAQGPSKQLPAGTYRATVRFTAATQ